MYPGSLKQCNLYVVRSAYIASWKTCSNLADWREFLFLGWFGDRHIGQVCFQQGLGYPPTYANASALTRVINVSC